MNHYQFNKKNFKPVYNDTCVDIQEKIEIITEKNNNILDRTTEKNKIIGSKKKNILPKEKTFINCNCDQLKSLMVIGCITFGLWIIYLSYLLFIFWYKKFYPEPETLCEIYENFTSKDISCSYFY